MRKLIAAACFALITLPAMAQVIPSPTTSVAFSAGTAIGSTFKTALSANLAKYSLTIENNNSSDSCWIDFGGVTAGTASKANGILLLPGGSFFRSGTGIPSDEIEANCTNASDTLSIKYQ